MSSSGLTYSLVPLLPPLNRSSSRALSAPKSGFDAGSTNGRPTRSPAGQGAAVAVAALVATAYRVNGTLALWVSVIPLSVILSSIPVSVNGWGVREATIVALATPLGVAPADALLVSVTLGALNVLASLPGALVMLAGRAA